MEFVILAAAVAVLAVVVIVGLVVRTARREPPRPPDGPTEPTRTLTAEPVAETQEEAGEAAATEEGPAGPETAVTPAPPAEMPAPAAGRLTRLRARLARSQNAVGMTLLNLLSRESIDEDTWEEIEDTLLAADVGVAATQAIVEDLRLKVKVEGTRSPQEVRNLVKDELISQIGADTDRIVRTPHHADRPAVVLVVGVNGTGKTTTCGKLGRVLIADGRSVLFGAADTFRAAAADQLETWGSRVGAGVVRGQEGADPASVAYETVRQGIERGVNVVVIDTAGRLHTKTGLMDELGKVKRVVEKQATVDEVVLVLDATTGQNGMRQAEVFGDVVDVTGIALTKLDGTAKGGIVISVQRELGVPVKLVGLGEGPDDLAPFDPEAFVDGLLGEPA